MIPVDREKFGQWLSAQPRSTHIEDRRSEKFSTVQEYPIMQAGEGGQLPPSVSEQLARKSQGF
jgi:hypothetical protein